MELHVKSFFRNLMGILALSLCISSNCFAQPDTTVTFHYPLNIGDIWEYEYLLSGQLFAIECREVIGDTLMPNGKTYRIIDTDFALSATKFQRIDSMRVYQFYDRFEPPNQIIYDEFLLYKLDLKEGDRWTYPPGGYDGFIADSGFVEVIRIEDRTLWLNNFITATLGTFTLPDTGYWFGSDIVLLASVGVLEDSFEGGGLRLRGAIIDDIQFGMITSIQGNDNVSADRSIVNLQNYPNPFNNSTTIQYKLNNSAFVRISIFNLLGERVNLLQDSFQTPGLHKIHWNGDNESGFTVASSVYFYLIEVNNTIRGKRNMFFLK